MACWLHNTHYSTISLDTWLFDDGTYKSWSATNATVCLFIQIWLATLHHHNALYRVYASFYAADEFQEWQPEK